MGKRIALLIATSRYLDPKLTTLAATVTEAQQLSQLLVDPTLGGFESAPVVIDGSKSAVERAVEDFLRGCGADDEVLLYLTGHGIKNDHDQLFFATSDTDTRRPYSTAMPSATLRSLLEECPARAKLVLLDCCYSGAFTKSPTHMSDEWTTVGDQFGQGTYVLAASNELEFAYVQEQLFYEERHRFSVFTDALIKGIATGAAARGLAEVITADDLYAFAHDEVRRMGVEQTPTKSDKSEGQFVVSRVRSRQMVVDSDSQSPKLADLLAHGDAHDQDLVAPLGVAQHHGAYRDSVLRVDLAGPEGHLAVVGRIYSGKSSLLHTLVSGLAHGKTPKQVTFHLLDGGGSLRALHDLPHVDQIIPPTKPRAVEALLDRLARVVSTRDRIFRTLGIPRAATYRELRNRDALKTGDHSDVFLIIDGWTQFADTVPLLEDAVHQVAGSGLRFGVHVVVTARHWGELPPRITPLLRGRVELQLDDPAESKLNPDLAGTLPDQPGWGLYNGRRFLSAIAYQDNDDKYVFEVLRRLEDPRFTNWISGEDDDSDNFDAAGAAARFMAAHGLPKEPGSWDPDPAWGPKPAHDRYQVPFGSDDLGRPVSLGLGDAELKGIGSHGLIVGAPGSGKSELLRTIVLGLLATHSPDDLNVVLVDVKGRTTFHGFDRAPHVAAALTELATDTALLDRLGDALGGEAVRRRDLLAEAGGFKDRREYEAAREGGKPLPPLPLLLVCVDGFSDVLTARPGFADVLRRVLQVGRSVGVHLLLASQQFTPEVRAFEAFLAYRIVLKTFSAGESQAVIGVPDAFELPPVPGSGYLAVQGRPLVRFDAHFVSGLSGTDGRSLTHVLVDRMEGRGSPAHEVWPPPLDEPPPLEALLPPLEVTEDRGLTAPGSPGNGGLRAPVAVVDVPAEQRRGTLWADFSGAAGHGAVVGGPQSGKSTLLRTLITSMALTHTPEEAQFYCLDLGGGTLASLQDLPHVGGFAGRWDVDKARRVVAELSGLVAAREQRFRAQGIDSVVEFRDRRRRGEIRDDDFGDAFLVVDGWMNFRQEFEALEPAVHRLVAQGLPYGVHVVVAANRWAEIRPAMKDLLGTRFELRLADTSESEVDRKVAVNVPADRPGRGLSPQKLHFLTALPRGDPGTDAADLVRRIARAWSGASAPEIRLLPDLLPFSELTSQVGEPAPGSGHLVPIGVGEDGLAPVYLDFDSDPHFMALADGESGKTNMLRTIVRGIMTSYTSSEALIMLVDYRRTMLGYIETDHLLSYAVSSAQLTDMIKDVRSSMASRLPGPDVTREQLANRSWWRGPELFVVVDDYDLVAPQGGLNPLQPLAEFIPQAKDVGLHIVAVRRMGGASRAMYDPILGKLKEIAAPVLIGSGSRDEGVIVGDLKPAPEPPGRGTLVTRKSGHQRVQVAWIDPG
ncbi:type VII secretion protein EccCb [Saccharothrix sp. HUAS TT1]|uniref:type VII secretion protein EccCb n=1 Tax=unclassified Saccharothrix TaxID=2593673 RepID=UPI00345B7AF7